MKTRKPHFLWNLFFISSFCIGLAFLPKNSQAADPPTIAVLDFENNSLFNRDEYQSLSKGLAEMMITGLNQYGALRVVERQKLRSIIEEIQLSQTGMVSETSSLRAGKLLGAQNLVFGGFMVATGNKIRIDVRIVEVETGLTVKANEVTGKTNDILSLIAKLNAKILRDLNVRISETGKKFEETKPVDVKALMFFSQGVGFEDAGEGDQAAACYQKALDIEPNFQQAKARLERLRSE
ncbi:MAG TPA: CsgG/HfaB family protein [bacterium]